MGGRHRKGKGDGPQNAEGPLRESRRRHEGQEGRAEGQGHREEGREGFAEVHEEGRDEGREGFAEVHEEGREEEVKQDLTAPSADLGRAWRQTWVERGTVGDAVRG